MPGQNLAVHKALFGAIAEGLGSNVNHPYDPMLENVLGIENRYQQRQYRK